MSREYRRRVQTLPRVATCAACREVVAGPEDSIAAEDLAAAHALETGHEVKVTDSRFILISPKTARKPDPCPS